MNPLTKSLVGAFVRALMLIAGAAGVDIAPADADALWNGVEMIINGGLIVVPIIWTVVQKILTHRKIQDVQATATFRATAGSV